MYFVRSSHLVHLTVRLQLFKTLNKVGKQLIDNQSFQITSEVLVENS